MSKIIPTFVAKGLPWWYLESEERNIRKIPHLLDFLSIGSEYHLPARVESRKIALRGIPFGAFLLAQGHRCYLTERVSTGRLYNPNPTSNLAICIGIKEVQALCHSHPVTSN